MAQGLSWGRWRVKRAEYLSRKNPAKGRISSFLWRSGGSRRQMPLRRYTTPDEIDLPPSPLRGSDTSSRSARRPTGIFQDLRRILKRTPADGLGRPDSCLKFHPGKQYLDLKLRALDRFLATSG